MSTRWLFDADVDAEPERRLRLVTGGTTIRRSRASRPIALGLPGGVNPLLRRGGQADDLGLVERALVGDDPSHVECA